MSDRGRVTEIEPCASDSGFDSVVDEGLDGDSDGLVGNNSDIGSGSCIAPGSIDGGDRGIFLIFL